MQDSISKVDRCESRQAFGCQWRGPFLWPDRKQTWL